jgi:hypothetical protein
MTTAMHIATVGCEFKTKTNSTTKDIEKVLASKFGRYQLINLSAVRNENGSVTVAADQALLFKQSIREVLCIYSQTH